MEVNRLSSSYELKSPLARLSLRATDRDPKRKLMWTNSICLLFLVIGIIGSNPAGIFLKPLPRLEEIVPVVVEPLSLPPAEANPPDQPPDQSEADQPDTPSVIVVTPDAPNINFSVPTIGNLVVPNSVAVAPPVRPMQPAVPLKKSPAALQSTGAGGERPQPPYPKIALDQGQQGTVVLLLAVDEAGLITSIEVKQSSGFPMLDRSALDFIKRHWKVVPGSGGRMFEAPINYKIAR
jgi:TonB family protein